MPQKTKGNKILNVIIGILLVIVVVFIFVIYIKPLISDSSRTSDSSNSSNAIVQRKDNSFVVLAQKNRGSDLEHKISYEHLKIIVAGVLEYWKVQDIPYRKTVSTENILNETENWTRVLITYFRSSDNGFKTIMEALEELRMQAIK